MACLDISKQIHRNKHEGKNIKTNGNNNNEESKRNKANNERQNHQIIKGIDK